MTYRFKSGEELLAICSRENIPISEVMVRCEMETSERSRKDLYSEMQLTLGLMRKSISIGISVNQSTLTGHMGGDSQRIYDYANQANCGEEMARIIAASMAVVEVNASMGKIVAAPTAGASGILPGVLIVCGEKRGYSDEMLCSGLFTAGAVGMIIAMNAGISGAECGCQAETGTAAAMAAAALTELCGGKPETALTASAITLKNVMGLVCDPVAGIVECPCIKRNAIGAANAVISADMALAGIESLIPFDEVVGAMRSVGRAMNVDLRETAKGGLAATPTAQKIAKDLGMNNQ